MSVVKSAGGGYDLVIANVSFNDAGQYLCIEDLGIGDRHITQLNVTGKLLTHADDSRGNKARFPLPELTAPVDW